MFLVRSGETLGRGCSSNTASGKDCLFNFFSFCNVRWFCLFLYYRIWGNLALLSLWSFPNHLKVFPKDMSYIQIWSWSIFLAFIQSPKTTMHSVKWVNKLVNESDPQSVTRDFVSLYKCSFIKSLAAEWSWLLETGTSCSHEQKWFCICDLHMSTKPNMLKWEEREGTSVSQLFI